MPLTLYLIDGHALAYRMYFALTAGGSNQRWQTSKGEPTAGIYGFARELIRILEQEKPEYMAVAFDTGKTFRDELFPDYKATRAKMPDDLRPQIERIRQMVDIFNLPRLEMEGYEADDVLGSVAKVATEQGLGVKIITGDRDLLQLVNQRTAVYVAGDDKTYVTDQDVANSKFGVPPNQVVDYKAIVGDKSDNIPGVPGVGEKTALGLLEKYGSLDEIYAHLDEIENRWRTKLEVGKDSAYMSRDLATIRTNLPVKLDLEHARADQFEPAALEAFFQELEFRTLVKKVAELSGQAPVAAPVAKPSGQLSLFGDEAPTLSVPKSTVDIDVQVVDTPAKLEALVAELNKAKVISFDTETTSTDEMQAELVGISLSVREGTGYYIPIGHKNGQNLPVEQVVSGLHEPLTNPKIGKVAHNAKYDYIVMARYGLKVTPLTFDTMIAEFVIDPGSRNLGLKGLAFVRLGEQMTEIEELIGKGKNQVSMAEVDVSAASAYAAADAEITLRLMPILRDELERAGSMKLMEGIEMPLITVLADMEMTGILIDPQLFNNLAQELGVGLAEIEKQVHGFVGKTFNLNSPQQVSNALFNTLGLRPPDRGRKTATGFYSTAAGVLEEMREQHPVVDLMLNYRELAKLKFSYADALPAAIDSKTGRVHTSYNQAGAITGRLSSNNPNLQQIPTRTELGRRLRNGFIAGPGDVLLSVDYSQIELRIVAHMAEDEGMLTAFRQGQDIHATTAAAIYSVPLEAVTKEMRRHAKAINFGLIYGMSAFGLTRSTELTLAESQDFVEAYFKQFPGVKRYLDGIRRIAAEQGYVETLLGRRRYFPMLKNPTNINLKNREEREAINAPIQGTAADIMKIAMLKIPAALQKAGLSGKMLLQVHDEIVLECPKSELNATARVVQETMEAAYPLSIPLLTEARWGPSWGEMQEVEG
ncbi:MAG: DNA polymerase I [Anaerolineales bacterium]|nr:DNA polymerase I [Anaerolineales bacterium]